MLKSNPKLYFFSCFRFCAFGIFTMVLSWVSAGLHLGVSVGLGDFCVNPDAYIERLGSKDIESGKTTLEYKIF